MVKESSNFSIEKKCEGILQKSSLEAGLPGTYFTVDEVSSLMKKAPLSILKAVSKLQEAGYFASPTSLNPKGFRTNCKIDKIMENFAG